MLALNRLEDWQKKSTLIVVCGIAIAVVGAITSYVLAGEKLFSGFKALQDSVNAIPGLEAVSPLEIALGLAAGLAVVGLSAVLPKWLVSRRALTLHRRQEEARLLLVNAEVTRVFRLGPIPPPPNDEVAITFERADCRHEEILRWLSDSKLPLLYVTGHSGSGKSSLMQAYVVPMLRRGSAGQKWGGEPDTSAVMLRAFGNIDHTVPEALGAPGCVWKKPPDIQGMDARASIEAAADAVRKKGRRLVLVFDQFEEAIVGVAKECLTALPAIKLVRSLQDNPIKGVTCVLVARAEYAGVFRELGLPERLEGTTWQDVPAFSIADSARFFRSHLWLSAKAPEDADTVATALAKEAETLSDLPDRITPIALNMIGQMYTDSPAQAHLLIGSRVVAADGVLAAYVRGRVESGDLREAGPAVLRGLVTPEGRRHTPEPLATIAQAAALDEGTAETALLTLARDGLVRRVGAHWEVAHDFLAPLLRRVLDRILGSLRRKLLPWLPAGVAGLLLAGLVGLWGWSQAELARDETEFVAAVQVDWATREITIETVPTRGAVHYLSTLSGEWKLHFSGRTEADPNTALAFAGQRISNVSETFLGWFNTLETNNTTNEELQVWSAPNNGFDAIQTLRLSSSVVSVAGMKALTRPDSGFKSIINLDLTYDGNAEALMELARPDTGLKSLTSLNLFSTSVTGLVLKEFARSDSGLNKLRLLNLERTELTDADLKYLAEPSSGLKALTQLDLTEDKIGDATLIAFTGRYSGVRGLTWLALQSTFVSDAGVKALADPNTGLKRLTTLYLTGTNVTRVCLQYIARRDSGLKALTTLYIYNQGITDADVRMLKMARPELKVYYE